MPIYNAEQYLAKCIDSLIHQSHTALQIILVNDASTDDSLAIAMQYAQHDNRIEVHSLNTNHGQATARNKGLQYATGQYISFVDADDFLDLDFYQVLLSAIEDKDCVQIGYKRITSGGKIVEEKLPRNFYQFTSPCMRLYKSSTFTTHNLRFLEGYIYEDVIFSLDYWATLPSYSKLKYTGYNYTLNTHSTTAKRNPSAEKQLFKILRHKLHNATNLRHWCIISYTIIRLKLHFLRYE